MGRVVLLRFGVLSIAFSLFCGAVSASAEFRSLGPVTAVHPSDVSLACSHRLKYSFDAEHEDVRYYDITRVSGGPLHGVSLSALIPIYDSRQVLSIYKGNKKRKGFFEAGAQYYLTLAIESSIQGYLFVEKYRGNENGLTPNAFDVTSIADFTLEESCN